MSALVLPFILLSALPAADPSGSEPPRAVAVVASLSGTASTSAAGRKADLKLFDWLNSGSLIEVGAGSTLTLAFATGARHELGAGARATLAPGGPKSTSGPIHSLPSVPPLPRLAAARDDAEAGPRSGAIRIRGARITSLYPRSEAATLPDQTVLRFSPMDGAANYKVEVEDESGKTVFEAETQSPAVNVSPGILKAGQTYYWKVRTIERIGSAARADAQFATLGADVQKTRSELRAALEKAADATSLGLLAEIDRSLGLLLEARDQLRAAAEKAPDDAGLRRALERVEKQLVEEDRPPAR